MEETPQPCGQPVLALIGTHGRTCLLTFTGKLLCFSLCLLTLVQALGATERNLAPSLHTHFRHLYT